MRKTTLCLAVTLFFCISATSAFASSYPSLVKQGYKTGTLTRGPSGSLGWKVTNGDSKYFCKLGVANAYVGSTGMVAFTSSGKQLKVSRKVFDDYIGGSDPNIPQLSDLKAGRLNKRDVGACSSLKK